MSLMYLNEVDTWREKKGNWNDFTKYISAMLLVVTATAMCSLAIDVVMSNEYL
jgi:hypothetical protein